MTDKEIPSQYKPLMTKIIAHQYCIVKQVEPIIDELEGDQLKIEYEDYLVIIRKKQKEQEHEPRRRTEAEARRTPGPGDV